MSRAVELERGIRLEYLTVAWNVLEGVVSIGAGVSASSIALLGFGIDSLIETSSGAVLLWRLRAERRGEDSEALERRAQRLVGVCFLLLAAWVAFESVRALMKRDAPGSSRVGIVVAILSLVVMPWLAREKKSVAQRLDSPALRADSTQTWVCAYLSAVLLVGLLLNLVLGWWWADPVAALCMVPLLVREGMEGVRGEEGAND
jgi:divalent metal cation (Fe/Co/Zn/Cd) transporter